MNSVMDLLTTLHLAVFALRVWRLLTGPDANMFLLILGVLAVVVFLVGRSSRRRYY